ncbi:MAG: 30S ribosomal protein S3 [Firmicutes bacterium]|nr:30S ribosomal protein S3 [Clostridiales bacterium]MBQ4339536.1 30S ribosomal protein S3 [Bacillota bacterium]
MGQKVNPHGLRVGVIKDWDSKWYANKKDFADYLVEDDKIRKFLKKKLYLAGVAKILIERSASNNVKVTVYTAKPGMVIGRSGAGIEEIKADVQKLTGKEVVININEVRKPELDAQLVAESVAQSLERRVSFRRAMKQAIGRTMKSGAKGIKVVVSGRVGGAEIARSEKYNEGNVPLHTLRANISYGFWEADTTYGKIGVKVWINHGEILGKFGDAQEEAAPQEKKRNFDKKRRNDGNRENRRERRDNREQEQKPVYVNPRTRKAPKEAPAPKEVVEEAAAEPAVEE